MPFIMASTAFASATPLSTHGSTPNLSSYSSVPISPIVRVSHVRKARVLLPVAVAGATSRTSEEASLFDAVVMNTYTRYPIAMSHGEGSTLFDIEGNSYIDCVAGIATCTLGHAHTGLQQAVSTQLGRLCHVSNLYYIPEQRHLATWLVKNSPADKAFFCNSGGEANEAAIKLARKHWHLEHPNRENDVPVIITAHNSFHGRTLATITATGQPKYQAMYWPLVPGFEYAEYNNVDDLKRVAEKAGDRLAGILLEPLQGEGGVIPGTKEYFQAAREICDRQGALLICDEVQTGVGRSGMLWGFENVDVSPDIFTCAKGLAGGVPIGAMCCKQHCDRFGPGDHASTFGGNPLATAAAAVVASELTERGLLERVKERGKQLESGLREIVGKFKEIVHDVRGWGLIRGVQINENVPVMASDVVQKCIEKGLLLVPAGPKVVRFVPPLVIKETEIKRALQIFEDAIATIAKEN